MLNKRLQRSEDGFTLKEIVITVAIVLVLSLVGFFSYQGFSDNAKRSAVERAANEVFTVAVSEDMLPNGRSMQEVEDDFNDTSDEHIRVEVEKDEATRDITVTAFGWEDEDPPYVAVRSTISSLDGSEGVPGEGDSEEEEDSGEFTGDINDYDDGVFSFTTGKEGSQLYMTGLSSNFEVYSKEAGRTYSIEELGIDNTDGGAVTFPGSGEFTVYGGFENIGINISVTQDRFYNGEISYEELVEKMDVVMNSPFANESSKILTWKDTGTMDISGTFTASLIQEIPPPPSTVTNMSALFAGSSFNGDISKWDVSNVENMGGMFMGASEFNQPLDKWDVSNVKNMSEMFSNAALFNQDISRWDVSNVTDMSLMFNHAAAFNNGEKPLDWEDTSSVRNMSHMFSGTSKFDQDISSWSMSNVEIVTMMFSSAKSFNNGGVSLDWEDTSSFKDTRYMFSRTEKFNQDISSWDVSNVTDMSFMFDHAAAFNNGEKPLDWEDTSSLKNTSYMFSRTEKFNQDISNWNVSNVEKMDSMFSNATSFNQDLSSWVVPNIGDTPTFFAHLGHPDFDESKHPQWGVAP